MAEVLFFDLRSEAAAEVSDPWDSGFSFLDTS